MVVYNSQYRKHYKDPRWDEYAVSEYSRKLDYRIGRRSVEHQHQPWSWDSEDEGSEVDQPSSREVERYQTPKESKKKKETSNEKKKDAKDVEKTIQSSAEKKQKPHKEPRKPRSRTKRTPKSKAVTAVNTSKDSNIKSTRNWREPFISYGWANTGPIGERYTYNVRASPEEVYPASLRALKRRELDVKRKQFESEQKATIEEELLREKFFKHGLVSPTFLTEYQRSYCLHSDGKTDWE